MTGEPLSGMQRLTLSHYRNEIREVFVLDNNRNVARCLVVYANDPQRLDKLYISAGGKVVGKFTYRQTDGPVAAVV